MIAVTRSGFRLSGIEEANQNILDYWKNSTFINEKSGQICK